MKIYEIILEQNSASPNTVPPAAGTKAMPQMPNQSTRPSKILSQISKDAAKSIKQRAIEKFNAAKNVILKWFIKVAGIGTPLIEWAYEMYCINYLFDNGYIGPIGNMNAGAVAHRMRKSITKEYTAHIVALLAVWGTSWSLGKLIKEPNNAKKIHTLLTLLGGGAMRGGILGILGTVGIQTLLYSLFSSEIFRKFVVNTIFESFFPELWNTVADLVGGSSAFIPVGAEPTIKKAIDHAKKAIGLGNRDLEIGITNQNRTATPDDFKKYDMTRQRF